MRNMEVASPNRPETGRHLREKSRKKPKKRRKQRSWLWIAAVMLLLLLVAIGLLACFRTDKVKGTWRFDEVTAYQFDGKGNGKLVLPDKEYAFTYQLTKEELRIDFENEAIRDSAYAYALNESQLTLKGGEGAANGSYTLIREDG